MPKMERTSPTSCKARKRKQIRCKEITEYLRLVETGKVRSCERQKKLCAYVRGVFAREELIIDTERIEKYGRLLEFFPFKRLFPWEWFVLTLFLCVFRKDGTPRWDKLICFIGRGGGKTGFIAFIAFCLLTAIHGIQEYDVDIIANTEKQAYRSFKVVYKALERHKNRLRGRSFDWNKQEITSLSTQAAMRVHSSNAGGLDGLASGIFICDEVHYMDDYENITTLKTGQGKCPHPRRAYVSSNGNKRDGVYDKELERCDRILDGEIDDAGYLPFICSLDDPDEVHDPRNWEKACPSLPYDEVLFKQTADDYADWIENPAGNPDFMAKRMGCPQGDIEHQVTSWDNLLTASRELPDLEGRPCVLGLDFARTDDFLSAVLLFKEDEVYYAIHHSWFCLNSRDRSRIKPPLEEWERKGIVTLVDKVEIPTTNVMDWIAEMQARYSIECVAVDDYRFDVVREGLESVGYSAEAKSVVKVRPSNHMRVQPIINSAFNTGSIAWGDDPAMRWFANNTKLVPFQNGNYKYEKIEPRGRKTDGFMALVAAFCIADRIPEYVEPYFIEPFVF